jgi:4-alpha-glucanotransferase
MKLTFRLRYRTRPGQTLRLTGNHEIFGNGNPEKSVPLAYRDAESWQATIQLNREDVPEAGMVYSYILQEADGSAVQDWGADRVIGSEWFRDDEVLVIDAWNPPGAPENAFYTEPFQEVLLRANRTGVPAPAPAHPTHTFKVKAPLLARGQTLCLVGESAAMGNWQTSEPVLVNRRAGEHFHSVTLDLRGQPSPLAYKYGVYDVERKAFVCFEGGGNRVLSETAVPGRQIIVNDGFAALPADTWKGAGVAIPVFSLRSESSFGVGEFEDLKLLADWAGAAGLKLIQILPVNDTTATHTWTDSYPYAAISAFALHPVYIHLARVATGRNQTRLKELEPERKRLNALDAVDYEAVMKLKLGFLREIFPTQKARTFASQDYRQFFARNRHWLVPYAAFCHLRDKFGTSDFNRWPDHRRCRPDEIAALAAGDSPAYDDLALNYFIQYHLHRQLHEATAHAHARGVIVKGDIPIGVYRHGADAWQQPELYHLEVQTGAPPDAFAVKGQNWGFPTYHWPRMKQDGFAWWKQRFEQMSVYFDAFRIDHILGFFRIWSIPAHAVEGILGHFVPAIPVEADEFTRRGIALDHDRYTRPFITDKLLAEMFGGDAGMMKREYVSPSGSGRFQLRTGFTTQREVERHFAARENNERHRRIREGLYDLISNVILLDEEAAPGRQFHFRFDMENTASFKELPAPARTALKELYVDYFFRRQDAFWMREAMQKLPDLKRATNMLVCGEDLGLVPACVPEAMKALGLLCLEIQRMPKQMGREFSRPAEAPYLSVVTPSSHDMSTIRGWWEEDRALTQKFFNTELGRAGEAPAEAGPEIVASIVAQHLASPAMWSIFQLQDLLGMDGSLRRADAAAERINVPANPAHYWRYRMHLTLEALLQTEGFTARLGALIRKNGR